MKRWCGIPWDNTRYPKPGCDPEWQIVYRARTRRSTDVGTGRTLGDVFADMRHDPYNIVLGEADVNQRSLEETGFWTFEEPFGDPPDWFLLPEQKPDIPTA